MSKQEQLIKAQGLISNAIRYIKKQCKERFSLTYIPNSSLTFIRISSKAQRDMAKSLKRPLRMEMWVKK